MVIVDAAQKMWKRWKQKREQQANINDLKENVRKEAELEAINDMKPELVSYYKRAELMRIAERDGYVLEGNKMKKKQHKVTKKKSEGIVGLGPMKGFGLPDFGAGSIFGSDDRKEKPAKGKKRKAKKEESMFEIKSIFDKPKKGKKEPSMFEMKSLF